MYKPFLFLVQGSYKNRQQVRIGQWASLLTSPLQIPNFINYFLSTAN